MILRWDSPNFANIRLRNPENQQITTARSLLLKVLLCEKRLLAWDIVVVCLPNKAPGNNTRQGAARTLF